MKILGIDSSGLVGSVAITEDGTVIAEYTLNHKKTHSETLLPMVDEIFKRSQVELDDIDGIAICAGPGSFTGLRIGSATAKGIGLATNKPLIPVITTEALCYNLYGKKGLICPIIDARRNQVYTGVFRFDEEGNLEKVIDTMAVDIEQLIESLNKLGENVVFLGDGVKVYSDIIDKNIKCKHEYAFGNSNLQRASSVALYGEKLYRNGVYEKAEEHAPIYLRVSQAERERMEKMK